MDSDMRTAGLSPCELLPWDTQFFQCRIARVRSNSMDEAEAASIDQWSRLNDIRCLYFLARPDIPAAVQTAEAYGYKLVDVRLTFTGSPENSLSVQHSAEASPVRPATEQDLARLEQIARTCHTGTRFSNDLNFSRSKVEELYSTWIRLDLRGRSRVVLVPVDQNNAALGYVSCMVDASGANGQIGLIAVSAQLQQRGLGRKLMAESCRWFAQNRVREVSVVTQGNNLAAQKLYQSCGFRLADLRLWYHKWYL